MSFRFALIGQPVKHSRSPQIHQSFAAQFDDAIDYQLIEVAPEEVAATIAQFFAEGGHGMNATLPHKQAALAACNEVSDDARLAKAVNTLVPVPGGGIRGENTDGAGCAQDLLRLGIQLEGARIAVIGAGGAAAGIIKPLLDQKPQSLIWTNRNPLKLEGREEEFAPFGPIQCRSNMTLKGDQFDLVINATAAGHDGKAPLLPHGLFAAGAHAYDLSYGAAAEPFLNWARQEGAAAAHHGLGMLIEQAALAYAHWTGHKPDTSALHAGMS